MDEVCALDRIARVWTLHANSIESPKLALLDDNTRHTTLSVHRAINATNAELEFILPEHASKLQPMDVGLNNPFEEQLHQEVKRFLAIDPLGE